jgi:hypothetical protein
MSVLLTGSGSLFERLGRIGRVLRSIAEFRAGGLGTEVDDLVATYDLQRDLGAAVTNRQPQARTAAGDLSQTLVAVARETLRRMVQDDQPARSWTVDEAVAEVVRQMDDAGESVSECLTSVSSTALTPFAGDGLLVTTIRGRDGATLENLFAEELWLTCVADAQVGDTNRYRETFRYRGGLAETDPWSHLWPAGSGGTLEFSVTDPATDAVSGGNLLTNSSWTTFASNVPSKWTIDTGTAGTEVVGPAAVSSYDGVGCLSLPGSATLAALSQTFAASTGTLGILAPRSRYAVSVRIKTSAVPATGTLILELTNSSNTVLNDEQGNPLRKTIDLTAATTSYVAYTDVWVTPRALPVTAKFRVRVGTAIETGRTAYVDHLALVPMAECYPGGPAITVVSGVTPFAVGDGWTLLADNDRATQDYGFTWQAYLDRLFALRALRLQLPSSGTPTIPDTLINA